MAQNLRLGFLEDDISQRDAEEENGHDNSGLEESFFNTAFGSVDIAVTAEGSAKTSAAGLQEHAGHQNDGQDGLRNTEDIINHKVARIAINIVRITESVACVNRGRIFLLLILRFCYTFVKEICLSLCQ